MQLLHQRPFVGAGRTDHRPCHMLPTLRPLRPVRQASRSSSARSPRPKQQKLHLNVASTSAPADVASSDESLVPSAKATDRIRVTFRWPAALGGSEVYITGECRRRGPRRAPLARASSTFVLVPTRAAPLAPPHAAAAP